MAVFWKKEKEIDKVLKKYGAAKGSAILTYYYSFVVAARRQFEFGRPTAELIPILATAVMRDHDKSFFAEYSKFFQEQFTNKALVAELDKAGNMYFDPMIFGGGQTTSPAVAKESEIPIQTNDPIEFLNWKAKDIMRNQKMLNQDGSISLISPIYYPETFASNILRFCKERYEKDGEKKIRSEFIITSFYSSICATILYKKNAPRIVERISSDHPLSAFNNFLDIEYADVAAEELLGTSNGQPLAETIWGIIQPYIGVCQNVFNSVSILDDEVFLAAIKNAYTMGMIVGDKYTSGQNKATLDLFTEKDVFKIESPYEINEETNGRAVKITGWLHGSGDNLMISISTARGGDAEIKVFPLNSSEQHILDRVAFICDTNYQETSIYGKLADKGRWHSELHYAFMEFTSSHADQLKKEIK